MTQRERFEASLGEEMRFHLAAQAEDFVRAGVPPTEAARRAQMQFGRIAAMKNECLRERGLRIADELASLSGTLRRVQWKTWYRVARLLRWAGYRDRARAAAQRGQRLVEAVSVRGSAETGGSLRQGPTTR